MNKILPARSKDAKAEAAHRDKGMDSDKKEKKEKLSDKKEQKKEAKLKSNHTQESNGVK